MPKAASKVYLKTELFESERWLSLPSDTHRLVFIRLLAEIDGVGNMKGGQRRIWRILRDSCHVKTPADSTKIMSELADADLVRRYDVDGDEYWHIPRHEGGKQWIYKDWPWSPWNDKNIRLTKDRYQRNKDISKNTSGGKLSQSAADVVSVSVSGSVSNKKLMSTSQAKTDATEVLEFLNEKTGRRFPPVESNLKLIMARFREGHTVADCRAVIARKWREWSGDIKMHTYARPKTLFNATNFNNYVGEVIPQSEESDEVS